MNRHTRKEMFARLARQRPNPTTELHYNSAFELLIAVILSAQATDESVNKATGPLFRQANTPKTILAMGEEKLADAIKTIGLYRNKARNVIATCKKLIEEHDSQVPQTRAELEDLPGVGRKTANVVLNTIFRQPVMAVDTHIFRVSNRTGLAPGKTVRAVEDKLMKNIPARFKLNAHHWLILHGRYVCKARKPTCDACIICDLCDFREKTAECSPELIARYATENEKT